MWGSKRFSFFLNCVMLMLLICVFSLQVSMWFYYFNIEIVVMSILFSIFLLSYVFFSSIVSYELNLSQLFLIGYQQEVYLSALSKYKQLSSAMFSVLCECQLKKIILMNFNKDVFIINLVSELSNLSILISLYFFSVLYLYYNFENKQINDFLHKSFRKTNFYFKFHNIKI